MNIDINLVRGLLTLVIFAAFIGIWVWAWSSKRNDAFDASAALPLEDDKHQADQEEAHR